MCRLANDVVEARDGTLYFSIASTKFGLSDWHLDLLEAKPHGQLLKHDPSTNQTLLVMDNLYFANGVVLSPDQDYLLVCETWKFRILKYWLEGDRKGKTEIFIENLPGGPDNINLAPDGTFWVALIRKITKLGEGFLEGPEDVCVDKEGILYAATRDGWIKRLYNNNSVEDWKMTNRNHLLGITATASGDLVVCDAEEGLLKVSEDGVTSIVSYFNNSKIRFADDVVEARDGTLYFSIASTKFGLHNWFLDVLEAKPHGQLLKHDPSTNHTTLVMDNLCFANGVALSADQDYLLVCETWKFRILKYWLEGDRKGQTETFIENLPGGPDNINLAPDGTFWVALIQLTSSGFEFVHTSKIAKHLIATFPALSNLVLGAQQSAMVVNVAADGRILRILGDADGRVTSFVTSAVEFEDHLYLGSLSSNFVGKLPL